MGVKCLALNCRTERGYIPRNPPDGSKTLRLLWDSKRIPGNTFSHNKFGVPVVANGKVYVPTYDGRVDVYGL